MLIWITHDFSACTGHKKPAFYHNIFVFYFNMKDLIYFCIPFVQCVLCSMQGICACGWMWCLCLSMWSVTKHGDQSPSLTGVNWVSDGVSIDFIEYVHNKIVCFYSSLERTVIVDSWERNGVIPMRTNLLLLSNRLQVLPVEQKYSGLVLAYIWWCLLILVGL